MLFAVSACVLHAQNTLLDSLENLRGRHQARDTLLVQILNNLSFQYLNSEHEKGLALLSEAAKLADSLGYTEGKAWSLVNRGNALWLNGLYDEALDWYYRARTLSPPHSQFQQLAISNNIAEVFKKKKLYDSALVYYYWSWELANMSSIAQAKTLLSYNLGELYKLKSQFDSAAKYFDISLREARIGSNQRYLAYALFGQGEIALMQKDLPKAAEFFQHSLEVREEIDDVPGIIQSLHKLAKIKRDNGDYSGALSLIDAAAGYANRITGLGYLSSSFYEKAKVYELMGSYQKSNEFLKKYHHLKDSLESQSFLTRSEKIKQALVSEINQREYLLSESERKSQLKEIRSQTWIIVIISIMVAVLFAYFFNYRRSLKLAKNQSRTLNELNEVILAKNKEIETINKQLDHKLINMTKLLFESQKIAKLGSWEYHIDTKEFYWTDETFRQLGLAPQQEKPRNEILEELVTKEDYTRLAAALKRTKDQGIISDESIKLTLKNGDQKHIRIRYFPEIVKGKLVRVYGSNQDITESVLTEEREKSIIQSLLELSRFSNLNQYDFEHFVDYLLRQAAATLQVERSAFWLYNQETKSLKRFKSFHEDEHLSAGPDEILLDDFPSYLEAVMAHRTVPITDVSKSTITASIWEKYLEKMEIRSILESKVLLDGEIIGVFSLGSRAARNWTFSDQRYVGSLTDIIATAFSTSQNKKLEREKGELINKLFKKSQNLEELAYVVSHNLRGPVTQIIGLADLYKDPQSAGLEQEIIERISASSHELDKVIKDLSEILKQQEIEAEIVEELAFKSIVHDVLHDIKTEWHGLKFRLNLSMDEGFLIYGKRSQINNIVYTLLSNSFKYRNPEKVLEITVNAKKHQNTITISFADNGLGIDMKRYEAKMFRMYQRFHPQIGGTGIGLFIVKNQVEAMGGTIEVSSHVNDGTIFTIELPDHAPLSVSKLQLIPVA